MIKYEREENGVKVSLEIDNEDYSSEEVISIIEQINTTVEIKDLKLTEASKYSYKKED